MRERILAAAILLSPLVASAYDAGSGTLHTATSIGGRATNYHPAGSDFVEWSPGVQLRLHGNKAYAVEASADFTHNAFGGTSVNVIPVQISALNFLYPDSSISPYAIAGAGWYKTRVEGTAAHAENRFGPHLGIGLQLILNNNWSLDGSYRFLWTQTIHVQDAYHPLGGSFSANGHMITLGLNWRL